MSQFLSVNMLDAMHTYVNDAISVHRYTVSVSVIGPCFISTLLILFIEFDQ